MAWHGRAEQSKFSSIVILSSIPDLQEKAKINLLFLAQYLSG